MNDTTANKCKHNNTQFLGAFSMVGGYQCVDCNFKVDPVIEHMRKGQPHIYFNDNHKQVLKDYLSRLPPEQLELIK